MLERSVITVSALNQYVKQFLSDNPMLSNLLVRGEISNFNRNFKSGHLYFTLKDGEAAVKAVMFRSYAMRVPFAPENGMSVIVTGTATLYERDGSYQLYVTEMQPDGIGALHLAYEQLKERLSREGLFDERRKRPLPRYPERIGIVTSEGAAALRDMLEILRRRYPVARVVLCHAQVQGEGAARTIIEAIAQMNAAAACDVLIVGRGGGSMEDLWAFNDEKLARAIAGSNIPIVSAVGHETDFTIADLAADLRAPTPSAAAELVAPNLEDVAYYMDDLSQRCTGALLYRMDRYEQRLQSVRDRLRTPQNRLDMLAQRIELCKRTLDTRIGEKLGKMKEQLRYLSALADERSPLRLLERGYSLTTDLGGKTISSVQGVSQGDRIITRVHDGELVSSVVDIKEKKDG